MRIQRAFVENFHGLPSVPMRSNGCKWPPSPAFSASRNRSENGRLTTNFRV